MPKRTRETPLATPEAQAQGLQQLGFTGYEARVYLALLQHYPVTAYEISKQTTLPRANVYNALASLEKKHAVQPVQESPVRYVPVDPRQLLDRIQRETALRCDALADELVAAKAPDTTEFVWTLSGDAHIHAKISEMIQEATQHVWVKAAHHLLEPHLQELQSAAKRGVQVMVILFGDSHHLRAYELGDHCKAYLHESNGVRVGLSDSLVTLTRDFEEAMTARTGADGYGVFTRSRPVVTMAESLLRHEIYVAEIFNHFAEDLERKFGPALYVLRHRYLPREQALELQALMPSAKVQAPRVSPRRSRKAAAA